MNTKAVTLLSFLILLLFESSLAQKPKQGDFVGQFIAPNLPELGDPQTIIFGPDGNLYVSSFDTDAVVRFNGATGALIDEFVSSSSSENGGLDGPVGLIFDDANRLYVASNLTNSVIRYKADGSFDREFVSAGTGGLSGPENLLIGPAGRLLVGSTITNQILRYNGVTGDFVDVFADASKGLDDPRGMLFDPDGVLLVASKGSNEVLAFNGETGDRVDGTPVETPATLDPVVSSDTGLNGGMSGPEGITLGPDGHLYVSSSNTDQVLRFIGTDYAGSPILFRGNFLDEFVITGTGGLDVPRGLVFGPSGNLFVGSVISDGILQFVGSTPVLGQFIDSGNISGPIDIKYGPDGDLYVSHLDDGNIARYDGTPPSDNETPTAFKEVFVSNADLGGSTPRGILFVGDDLYISNFDNDEVIHRNASGTIRVLVESGDQGLDGPQGLDIGPDGHLYVASSLTNEILIFETSRGDFVDKISLPGDLITVVDGNEPLAVHFGPDNNLYVGHRKNSSPLSGAVLQYDVTTRALIKEFVTFGSGGLNWPAGMVFGLDGDLYVSSQETESVLRYNGSTGEFIEKYVNSGTGGVQGPTGIVVDPNGDFLVASFYTSEVFRYGGRIPVLNGTVTFQVDMRLEQALGKIGADEVIGVRGNQPPLSMSNTLVLEDGDGDGVFSKDVSFVLPENTVIDYQFVHNVPGQDPGSGLESVSRLLTFTGDANQTVVPFNNIAIVAGNVTFQVDMKLEQSLGNIGAGEIVGVRGNQPPLSPTETLMLSDPESDGIFTGVVPFVLAQNTTVEYQFVHNVPGEDPGSGLETVTRSFTLTGDTQRPLVFFNDVGGIAGTVTFQVDMNRELIVNPPAVGEIVGVRGNQPPLSLTETLLMSDDDQDGVFSAEVAFLLVENTVVEYQFVRNVPGQDPGTGLETVERSFSFTGDEELSEVFFNDISGVSSESEGLLPTQYALEGNFPNPFRNQTRIAYALPEQAQVNITVFDVTGREVHQLEAGDKPAGRHEAIFDASNLSNGVYFYQLQAGDFVATGKMLLVK